MPAPERNEYYKLRLKSGRNRVFNTPNALATKADEYFQWCMDNPLIEEQVFHAQGLITRADVNKLRPFTLEGLAHFIGLTVEGLKKYEAREDFVEVTSRIRQIIDLQQFEGAAAGFLNPNIIARKLGLVDKKDHTTDGESMNKGFAGLMQAASVIKEE